MNEYPPVLRGRTEPERGTSACQPHAPGKPAAPKQRALSRTPPHRNATPIQSASPTQHRPNHSIPPAAFGGTARDRRPFHPPVSTSLCVATIQPFTRFAPGIVTQNCPFSALKTENVFVRTLPINGLCVCQSKPGQLCGDIPNTAAVPPVEVNAKLHLFFPEKGLFFYGLVAYQQVTRNVKRIWGNYAVTIRKNTGALRNRVRPITR
jgi:hypothetical protein